MKEEVASKVFLASVDTGFGDVKVCFPDGRFFKFPTAIAYAKAGLPDVGEKPEEYEYLGKNYLVGESALGGAFPTRSFEFLLRYAPLLCHKGIKDDSGIIHLGVGLPLAFYTKENRDKLAMSLGDFRINGEQKKFKVDVFPQGVSLLIDYRYGEDGTEVPDTDVDGLCIDVGWKTIDAAPFERGIAVRDGAGMIDGGGTSKMCDELAAYIESDMKIQLNEQETKDVFLKGELRIYGKTRDLSEVIRQIVEKYVDELIHTLSSRWEKRIQRAQKLILGGGGAYYLRNNLPKRYKDLIYIPDNPEFANARAYLKAILVKLKAGGEEYRESIE